ncbi:MAG: SurA N-terminal domain-containing protein [Proteobacteria bacterium]|nr:SurA N-terminal domain-containing protein [Pseudomonadota bacterium]
MLNFLRKRATSWFIKAAFFLIIVVFIFWGVGTVREKEQTIIGEVNGKKISIVEFQNATNLVAENYRAILGDKFDYKLFSEQIKKTAWDMLVDQAVLMQVAEELKIQVSPQEVIEEIQKNDAFKENGVFKREKYVEVLRYNKIMPSQFESQIEKSLLLKKVRAFLKNAVTVTDSEIKEWYLLKNRKIKAGYITLNYKDFVKEVTLKEEDLKKYYEENKEKFKKPEKATITYYILPISDFVSSIKPDEKDLKDYYNEHKDEFYEPKKYTLRHIFVAFGKDRAQSRNKIEEAKKSLEKEDFAKVAGKFNEDGTKARGGLLGDISLNMVTPKLATTISTLKKGDISGVVESEYGYHILKVDDIREEKFKDFEEVKETVKEKVIQNKAKILALKNASEIKDALDKGQTQNIKFKPEKADVQKDKPVINDMNLPELVNNIFTLGEGKTFGPFNISKGIIVGKVDKIDKGYFTISEVQERVREEVIKNKALNLAEERAKKMISEGSLPKGKETDWFSPVAVLPAPFNTIKDIDKEIPSLDRNNKVLKKPYRSEDSVYIVYLIDIQDPQLDQNSEDYKKFASDFIENKQNMFFEEWLKNAKKNAKIKLNEERFKSI